MVKTFDTTPVLTEVDGSIIKGTIPNFSSTGILDKSTQQSLIVEDNKITVKNAAIESLESDLTVKGDVKVLGTLNVGQLKALEVITNQRYEKQYLEFAGTSGESAGSGLLWRGSKTRQFVFRVQPDRFWITENIDLPSDKSFMFDGVPALSRDGLGNNVVNSNLKTVGTLNSLNVAGNVNIADYIFFDSTNQRIGLGTDSPNGLISLLDYTNNVEIIIDSSDRATGRIGTFGPKSFELVTDNQVRVAISESGNITIGHEQRDTTITRIYGKLSIGVKNPTEQFEVSGNMKFGNRLFTNGDNAPTQGTYQKGDIVWNSNPRSNSHIGWVCIAGGNPGVWKPFGEIFA